MIYIRVYSCNFQAVFLGYWEEAYLQQRQAPHQRHQRADPAGESHPQQCQLPQRATKHRYARDGAGAEAYQGPAAHQDARERRCGREGIEEHAHRVRRVIAGARLRSKISLK